MKSPWDFADSDAVLRLVSARTGWSSERLGELAKSAEARLGRRQASEPRAPSTLERRVPAVVPVPPADPARAVRMQLASGRTVRVRLPDVATRHDVENVRRVAEQNARRQSETLTLHGRTLDALSRDQGALEQRLDALQAQADLALLLALRTSAPLARKVSETAERVRAQEQTSRKLQTALARERRTRTTFARANRVREAVSSMQVAAYGRRGNVFAGNNLLLGGSELLWGSLDELARRAGFWSRAEPFPLTWLGPLLGLVAGHATLGKQQFDRFVTGELALEQLGRGDGASRFVFTGTLDLRAHVAAGYWDEFRQRPSVPATAQVAEGIGVAIARVAFGTLQVLAVSTPAPAGSLNVSFSIDLGGIGG